MRINNNFNVLPWYDSISRQNSKKWYSFGQHYPLICPDNSILPFQFVIDTQIEITGNIKAVSVESNDVTDLGIKPSVTLGTQTDANYYIVKQSAASIPELPVGLYYFTLSTSAGVLYSEEVVVVDNLIDYVKIEYWNESTLNFTNGEIDFSDDFRFNLYVNTTIGKPEYQFEEELTKRLGYKFIESQTSNKLYRFNFLAPEYLCDSMRLMRLCDYIKISTKDDSYNALTFAYEPKWQEQGDLAAVECEFETDCIIQKLESFNRRLKESFYNALLSELDEPILFSTDTIAQYYNEFTTTALVNGKLIRQLDAMKVVELRENIPNIFLPVDNASDNNQKAKKLSISDLLALSNISDISKLFKGHFDENGNLLWIEALSHIGVNGGVTMFIDNGTMSLPQLYSGLPIDGKTLIRDKNGVLMINPDIDLGGASTWEELKGKPSWITTNKPKWSYEEDIIGKPDLSVYAKSTEVEELLKKYVTLDTDETINGLKNFTKGLQIDGLGITKSQDDVVYLDANLVVRGGITMFGTNSVDVSTIMDAIATDNVNLKVVDGVLTFVGSSGGGLSEVYWDDVIGKPTLLSSFIDDVGYLQKSGGQMTGNIGYTLERDTTYSIGLPVSGSASFTDFYSFMQSSKTFIGSILNSSSGAWFDLISLRHTNGHGDDGAKYGIYIITKMNENDNLSWNKQINGAWQGERVILDSVNWSNYIQVQGGGSFISTSGGRITNSTTGLFINRTTEGANPHITFEVNGNKVGDLGIASHGEPAFYSYGMTGSTGWKRILYDGASTFELKDITIQQDKWGNGIALRRTATGGGAGISSYSQDIFLGIFGIGGAGKFEFSNKSNTTVFSVNQSGDVLANGGITMYSDQRKKTILNHVELTLQQIANAPLIEHYYNSDEKRTTHVGSIAQYWAGLNDWFCKLDGEGYYTMEIQNAALASAISIARELTRYESATDREIRELKDRIKQLESKIKQLKSA